MPSVAKKPVKIAVTGPPASGKSTLLSSLASLGVPVFSADKVVRELSAPCQKGYHTLCRRFGQRFLTPSGELDRRLILETMLTDENFKKTLEEIFHPLVREKLAAWFDKHQDKPFLAAEIPLLYQAGWEKLFDLVIWLECPEKTLLKRLKDRLGDETLARKLLSCYQRELPAEKRALIWPGDLPPEKLRGALIKLLQKIKAGEDLDRL